MRFRSFSFALALTSAFGASRIGAQMPGAGAKAAAQRAADAANAQVSQQTGQAVPQHTTPAPNGSDLSARLRSMPSQNVAPIKTGSATQPATAQQPATQQPAPQQAKPATAIPRARTERHTVITSQSGPAPTPTPSKTVVTKPAAKPVETKPVTSAPTPKPAETAPSKAVAQKPGASKPVEAPVPTNTHSADTTVMQQGGPAKAMPATPAHATAAKPGRDSVLVMRELFEYSADGRRDPFISLMTTNDLRPTVSDLRLTSVLYDQSGRRPVAIMRDSIANVQWRVTTGMTLGRMRVASIRPRVVVFTIEEFGFSRQDSLMLRDTTRVVRSK